MVGGQRPAPGDVSTGRGQSLHQRSLLRAEPRRLAGFCVRFRVLRVSRRGDDRVDSLVRQRPLEQRLRPRLDAERAQRLQLVADGRRRTSAPSPSGRIAITATPSSAASGSSSRSQSRSSGLYGTWRVWNRPVRSALASSSERARRRSASPRAARSCRRSRSASSHGRCSRQATRLCTCSTSTRPNQRQLARELLAPSSTEPAQIFVATTRPSRRPSRAVASDSSAPPYIGDESNEPRAGLERGADHLARQPRVGAERLPRAEPDDRPEAPLLHHAASCARAVPAANAAAKNHGSSSGPRPMCESGRPAQASRQPDTSTSVARLARSGARPGSPPARRPRTSRATSASTASVWCETPRWRSRGSRSETRSASTRAAAERQRRVDRARPPPVPPCPSRVPVPTMPGPIAADDDARAPSRGRERERRVHVHRVDVAAEAGAGADRQLQQLRAPAARAACPRGPAAARRPEAARTRRAARAARRRPARPGCGASSATTGSPSSSSRQLRRPPRRARTANWIGVYGSFITCAPGSARQLEAAGEVGVQDVEPARAEAELPRLDVDEHLVALLDRPRQPQVRDARRARRPRAARSPQAARARPSPAAPKRERHATRPR